MNLSMLWAHSFGCYEQLKVIDDMNNLESYELGPLGDMNNPGLWMIWTIIDDDPKALNVMNT